jgi:anti-sigma factor RsiW
MNEHDLPNALLLHQSGELSPEETADLEAWLAAHPEAEALAREYRTLQQAERLAAAQTVPPLNDRTLEAIRNAARPSVMPFRPRILALAAGLLLAVTLLPFLRSPDPFPVTADMHPAPATGDLSDISDLSNELDELQEEVATWNETSILDLLLIEEEVMRAEDYLKTEESI